MEINFGPVKEKRLTKIKGIIRIRIIKKQKKKKKKEKLKNIDNNKNNNNTKKKKKKKKSNPSNSFPKQVEKVKTDGSKCVEGSVSFLYI